MSKPEWRPQEMPSLLVSHLSRLMTKRLDEQLASVGLTVSQLPVIVSLKDGGELTQKQLADLAGVAQPSMAQLLARMERDGLIRRTPSATDGRISLISLTAQARRRLEPGRSVLRNLDQEACAVLSEDERSLLTSLLQRLVRHAEGAQ